MWALKTQPASADGITADGITADGITADDITADGITATKHRREIVHWLTCVASAIAVLMAVSTSRGQQESSRAKSIAPSSAPASSLGNALGHRLQQFRNAGTQAANTDESQSDRAEHQPFLGNQTQDAEFDNTPNSPEIEVAAVVPEPFLDLTRETQTEQAASSSSETSAQKSLEITAGSNPTQVLMRAVAWIVIALCMFSLTILGLRHWQRQRGLLPTTSSRSRVLETLSLGPGRTVSLIELAGFRALVASDAGGIRSLVLAPQSFHDELTEFGQATDQQVSKMTHQV